MISNIVVSNVAKATNLAGEINELRYEVTADVTPEDAGRVQRLTFEIPNAMLVADANPPPPTGPSGGGGGGGGGGGSLPTSANVIAAIAGSSVDVIFPSLQKKLQVSTSSDEEARNALFRDPNLSITTRINQPGVVGLDVIPEVASPGISGTVDLVVVDVVRILIAIIISASSKLR